MEMRRKDRQMPEEFAWGVVDRCDYAVLAMTAENGEPYCVPVNIARDGKDIYFHCAVEGRKITALRANPRVCLNCVTRAEVLQERYTTLYESATAFGTAEEVTEPQEKTEALRTICLRHAPEHMERFEAAMTANAARTAVWRIVVDEITGKCNR